MLCKEEGAHAVNPDPLSSFFLRKPLPRLHTSLTLPFCLTQGHWSRAPVRPVVDLATAVLQIRLPGAKAAEPPLTGLGVERRVALPPRRRPRDLPGEPLRAPDPARFSSACWLGRRRETMGRRRSLLDWMAHIPPYRFGSPGL
jgi:hypothetical protein